MFEVQLILPYLLAVQWIVACLFVPILCWYEGLNTSKFCVSCAVVSGYFVQYGFYRLMEGAGFKESMLILFSAMAAFIWIHYLVRAWPTKASKPAISITPVVEDNSATAS
ncbi:hypothetical protein [Reinekea sp.]|jgi:hypothetical protein|uniref:hypothetical protein n=1 Tax=Reinekea sp. TaxID=1970455 RepID=UPI003989269C